MSYQVALNSGAKKDLKRLSEKNRERVIETLKAMAENPFAGDYKKLSGSPNGHRIRVGDYRILFAVLHTGKIIHVSGIKDRKDAY